MLIWELWSRGQKQQWRVEPSQGAWEDTGPRVCQAERDGIVRRLL
jgi:hypothetical protein